MGIDKTALEIILISQKYQSKKGSALTLGRQGIHINQELFSYICAKNNISDGIKLWDTHSENFFRGLGYQSVESIDASNYESATMIHDLNKPVPLSLHDKYDYIYDGGTVEHIFNAPQVFDNIISMLHVDGIFCSVTCNNNFSGHGFYQYSPDFFISIFQEKYGMKLLDLYLARVNDDSSTWVSFRAFKEDGNKRNEFRFHDNTPVYILIIAQKIKNSPVSILTDAPQQHSYESMNWLQ